MQEAGNLILCWRCISSALRWHPWYPHHACVCVCVCVVMPKAWNMIFLLSSFNRVCLLQMDNVTVTLCHPLCVRIKIAHLILGLFSGVMEWQVAMFHMLYIHTQNRSVGNHSTTSVLPGDWSLASLFVLLPCNSWFSLHHINSANSSQLHRNVLNTLQHAH